MSNFGKNLALWAIIGLLVIALFQLFQGPKSRDTVQDLAFSEFLAEADSGAVREITVRGDAVTGFFSDGRAFSTYAPPGTNYVELLHGSGVSISAVSVDGGFNLFGMLLNWFPLLLLVGVWRFFMRQMQSGGGTARAFGTSLARPRAVPAGPGGRRGGTKRGRRPSPGRG